MSESPDPELAYAESAARGVMRISEGNDNPARVIFGPLLAEIELEAGDELLYEDWPCPTVRALASAYRHHDGWQESWGPT